MRITLIAPSNTSDPVCPLQTLSRLITADGMSLVIQGMSDSGIAGTVKEEELSKSIEFLAQHTFASGIQGENRRLDNGQVAHDSDTDSSDDQIEARRVKEAKSITQKKAVRELLQIDDQQIDGYISHIIDGYRMRLERGMMGMEKVN
jgi:GTPase